MIYILISLCAILALALILLLIQRSREVSATRVREAESLARNEALQEQNRAISVEYATLQEQNRQMAAKAESDKAELEKLQASFRIEFRNMANDILEEKSRQFKVANKESLEVILAPFRTNITQFRERVEQIYTDEAREQGALKTELRNLMELNRRITEETTNLTNALRGNSKVQGDWGEMILETILESSNLIKGVHYLTQEVMTSDEGSAQRPDVILNLPDKKQVVIDSKVSLTAFVGYTTCSDASQRDTHLRSHLDSVRSHVKELGSKRYQSLVNSPDFVIMFMPNEPAFMAALQHDTSIWSDAYNKKVIISSPTNLFALLKIVDDLWRRDAQGRNALAIAEAAGALYDKFAGFGETLAEVGKNIDTASRNYEKAVGMLKTGKGNIVGRIEKLREMGAKASKNIPAQLALGTDEEQ